MDMFFTFKKVLQVDSSSQKFGFVMTNLCIFRHFYPTILTDKTLLEVTMEISDIKIRKTMHEGRLRAVVSITIDNAIAIHDIKLVQGDDRMFVAMPSRREESGMFRDIIHPISSDIREQLEKKILCAYHDYMQ